MPKQSRFVFGLAGVILYVLVITSLAASIYLIGLVKEFFTSVFWGKWVALALGVGMSIAVGVSGRKN